MSQNLERLQKQLMGDGPAEKQILLMKLIHEFENAPYFGDNFISDANSVQQKWIARTGALLSRADIEHKLSFQGYRKNMSQMWRTLREGLRREILAAAEEIKLELELDGHEEIGRVYEAQQQYDF